MNEDQLTLLTAEIIEAIDKPDRDLAVQLLLRLRDQVNCRQTELLQTIVRLTNEVPFKEELEGWQGQRSALICEVGSLRARVKELELELGLKRAETEPRFLDINLVEKLLSVSEDID